jgi:D-serine deaminase-like pyridoxal phosphate-dependent protein
VTTAERPATVTDLTTPALVADRALFDRNVATMSERHPGGRLRPHVKAFKSTALAAELAAAGHRTFCCATLREVEGLAAAGLGEDVLLANETVDAARLRRLTARPDLRLTVAVDSDATLDAARAGGVREVLVDVNVGLPRCGCDVGDAGRLADAARAAGIEVRGVMGYEGHCQHQVDPDRRAASTATAMAVLARAHADVGGDVVSGGGTGTFALNSTVTEVQAGSYVFMDLDYARLTDLPFAVALFVVATCISVGPEWYVLDAGLKAFGMDSGPPAVRDPADGEVWFCSDEHTTVRPGERRVAVGDRVWLVPGHVDPTVAKHEAIWILGGEGDVVDRWAVDLRGW